MKKEVSPDIIFLDINMPMMNGFEFLSEINKYEAFKNIPVIMFSTTSSSEAILKAKQMGATDLFQNLQIFLICKLY